MTLQITRQFVKTTATLTDEGDPNFYVPAGTVVRVIEDEGSFLLVVSSTHGEFIVESNECE